MSEAPSAPLWTWRELCQALDLPVCDGPDVHGIKFDSRQIEPGDLFLALPKTLPARFRSLPSPMRDGHEFGASALRAGAAGIMAQRNDFEGSPVLRVPCSMEGLWALARARRTELQGTVVALTGSAGKTTLKRFLAQALQAHASQGNYNNHLGVPLCLANTPRSAAVAVYEVATNSPGEISKLSRLLRPDIAVLLNVSMAHVGNFSSVEALTEEKLAITDGLLAGGRRVVPETLSDRVGGSSIVFGTGTESDVRYRLKPRDQVQIETSSDSIVLPVPGGGAHRAQTLAAAGAVLFAMGCPLSDLRMAAQGSVPSGRGNTIRVGDIELIDDSYNASPASMNAALEQMAHRRGGRRVAILGDMRELGQRSVELHMELAPLMAEIEQVICVGEYMRRPYQELPQDRRAGQYSEAGTACLEACVGLIQPGDAVLVKGSNTIFCTRGFVGQLVNRLQETSRSV